MSTPEEQLDAAKELTAAATAALADFTARVLAAETPEDLDAAPALIADLYAALVERANASIAAAVAILAADEAAVEEALHQEISDRPSGLSV